MRVGIFSLFFYNNGRLGGFMDKNNRKYELRSIEFFQMVVAVSLMLVIGFFNFDIKYKSIVDFAMFILSLFIYYQATRKNNIVWLNGSKVKRSIYLIGTPALFIGFYIIFFWTNIYNLLGNIISIGTVILTLLSGVVYWMETHNRKHMCEYEQNIEDLIAQIEEKREFYKKLHLEISVLEKKKKRIMTRSKYMH